MFIGYVYKATCSESNKVYIGITTVSFDQRKGSHLSAAFNKNHVNYHLHFYNAIRKYGIQNFDWVTLEEIKSNSLETLILNLRELEILYIDKNDSFNNGYNGTPGGELTFRGIPKVVNMFNEDKELLDTGTVGYLSEKYSLDLSGICKVCNRLRSFCGNLNKKRLIFRYEEDDLTEEDVNNLAAKSKRLGYPIKGYFLDSEEEIFSFNSAKEAAESTGFCKRSICNCASGKYAYSGKIDGRKVTWKYIE